MSFQVQPTCIVTRYVVTHTDQSTMEGVHVDDVIGAHIIWGTRRHRGTTEVVDTTITIDGMAWPSWSWRDGPEGVWTHEVCETDYEADIVARAWWPYSKDHCGFDAEGYWR